MERPSCRRGCRRRMRSTSPTDSPRAAPTGPRPRARAGERQAAARRDPLGEVQQLVVDEGRQGLLLRTVSRAAGRQGARSRRQATRRSTTTCSAPTQSADRLIYERPEEPMLFIDADARRDGRYLFIHTNKGTSNKNELFVKDLGDPLAPRARRAGPRALPGSHRRLRPARRRERHAVSADRSRRAATRRSWPCRSTGRTCANWKTIVPGDEELDRVGARWSPGKLARQRAGGRRERGALLSTSTARRPGRSTPPALGTDQRAVSAASIGPKCSTRSRRRCIRPPCSGSTPATGTSTPFEPPKLDLRSVALRDRARLLRPRRTARACRCSSRTRRT